MSGKRNLAKLLAEKQKPIRAIYISSYIPRKCGIGTFTKDLTDAINKQNPEALAEIVALNETEEDHSYPWEVKLRIRQDHPEDYVNAANYLNQSSADIVNLQHEFGLFGGTDGEYILTLVDVLNKPLVTCFHTILPEPDEHKKHIMSRIVEKSVSVIAMSEASKELLINVYGADPDKAVVIYHGVPDLDFENSSLAKEELQIDAEYMLMVSGFFSSNKGFEYVLEAMPAIVKEFPGAKLYLVGETHPNILRIDGVDFKEKYLNMARELRVENNVVFVSEFLELEELTPYFKAADIYITPHLDPQQPTSGTLAKALGAGKVCISTPYFYAEEMLANNVGILVPFKDSPAIAEKVLAVLKQPSLFKEYRANAYKLGKMMQWPRVARRYLNLFQLITNNHESQNNISATTD